MTKKVRFVVLKSAPSDIVLIWGGRLADLRGTSFGLRELVQVGFLPRLPEPVPGPLRLAPSSQNQAALDGSFVVIIGFQFEHTDGLYGSQYRRLFF